MKSEALIEEMLERPSDFGYHGTLPLFETWGFTPFGVHRDSNPLERSNHRVILEDLQERFPRHVEVVHCRHWAVGWVDQVAVRLKHPDGRLTKAAHAVLTWNERLDRYPVADEDDWLAIEREEIEQAWEGWLRGDFERALAQRFPDAAAWIEGASEERVEALFRQLCDRSGRYAEHDGHEVYCPLDRVVEAATQADADGLAPAGPPKPTRALPSRFDERLDRYGLDGEA